ncbi:carcinoembryonic antigen-related cell adhesion molecule 16-like [Terrapene carolina triunguis]|uniref:carcinoembryonic antigen-related cell adhesion molecule 16-like n=1 Tax=Terrapene triunguis TaxID=2587831 RepID=UPI000E777CF4|nr:carcinoembryonic antigen-related cell adhesion molecule 16-like [Terrapene carolina triunguis]
MGTLPASRNRPGPDSAWMVLILAASIPSSCLQPAQARDGLTIRREPATLDVGGDMTLVVLGIDQTLLVCSWYRGAEAGIAAKWILSYAPSATPQKFYGPAHTGRETVGPTCSLHITGLRGTDAGSYTLTVQGPGYNQAISMSVSFSARPVPWFLAVVVGVPLAVLVCVALLVTFIVCKRRRGSGTSNLIEPPGERTGIVPK